MPTYGRYPRIPLPRPRAGKPGEPSYNPNAARPYPKARAFVAPPAPRQGEPGRPPASTSPQPSSVGSAFFAPALPQYGNAPVRPTQPARPRPTTPMPPTKPQPPYPPSLDKPRLSHRPPYGGQPGGKALPPSDPRYKPPPIPPTAPPSKPGIPIPPPPPFPPPCGKGSKSGLPCPPGPPVPPPTKPPQQQIPQGYNPYKYDPYRPLYGGPYGPPLQKASKSTSNPCAPDQVWDQTKDVCRAPSQELGCCPSNLPPGLNCPVIWPPCGQGGDGKPCCPAGATCDPSIPPCSGGGGGGGGCCDPAQHPEGCPPGTPICPTEPPVCLGCCAGPPDPNCTGCPPGCPGGSGGGGGGGGGQGTPCGPGGSCPPGCNCDASTQTCDCGSPQGESGLFDSQGGGGPHGFGEGEMWPELQGQGGGTPAPPFYPGKPPGGGGQGEGEMWPDLSAQRAASSGTPVGQEVNYTRIPTAEEISQLPPGTRAVTPWGEVQPDENGEPRLVMNEQGKAAYLDAHSRAKRAYGPSPFAGFQGAPEPEIVVGGLNFNPFTGMWSGSSR